MTDIPLQDSPHPGAGWQGFTDFLFMGNALLTLSLAAILGAVIAFHPKNRCIALNAGDAGKAISIIVGVVIIALDVVTA